MHSAVLCTLVCSLQCCLLLPIYICTELHWFFCLCEALDCKFILPCHVLFVLQQFNGAKNESRVGVGVMVEMWVNFEKLDNPGSLSRV